MSYVQISQNDLFARVRKTVERSNGQNPLRICHLSKYYPPQPGGIETHVRTLATSQAALGAQVDVICVNACDRTGEDSPQTQTVEEFDRDVRVIRLGRMATVARFDMFTEFSRYFKQRGTQYDIAHLHAPNPAMGLHWALSNSSVPLVVTHHSDIVKQRVLKHVINPLLSYVYHRASRVLISNPLYANGSDFLRPYHHRVEVLPFGIDLSIYQQPSDGAIAYAEHLRSTYGSPIWLSVGRLVYYKALCVAIEALKFVPGTLMIVGKGQLAETLKQRAKEAGVSDRVVWKPYLSPEELVGAYHAATALWFPSNARSEAFGLVQVEAMASGCPVINAAIPHSGVTWVSRDRVEGLTVPVNDPQAMAQAARHLLTDPDLRERLSAASRVRAGRFDQDLMAQESLRIYQQVMRATAAEPVLV
ncbi:glycosyltransferase [Myxacorys almedinensis]|uniref:Glycosyltransferase n=1 Tax=Myxacorys almedinensis A TaxID=2690445 RepID=A0A8J7YZG9_9CYAN|nr:glycosyltransferase [Myxacorys almedinensis]NDJ16210.1 glycosyltransferase [Myxacorys almedinensis A]